MAEIEMECRVDLCNSVLPPSFDVELEPILNKAKKRWRLACATIYSIRALLPAAPEIVAKKQRELLNSAVQASFDGLQLAPILNKARKRWRLACATLYSIRALISAAPEIVVKKQGEVLPKYSCSPHTVIDVEPDHSAINQLSLTKLFEEKNLNQLRTFGGVQAIASALGSNAENGIQGDVEDIACRHKEFGSNTYQKPPKYALPIVLHALNDPIILILLTCATFSLGFGIKKHGLKGWYDGGSVLVSVSLVVTIIALSKFLPTRQLNNLPRSSDNIRVEVIRDGQKKYISNFDVVVGDVVLLKIGDQVPANGLFIDGDSLKVDKSSMTGKSDPVEFVHSDNPFLLSGSQVADGGDTRMLVTSVGMNTAWGERRSSISFDSNQRTPLEDKLNKLRWFITMVGLVDAFLVLFVLLIRYFMGNLYDDNGDMLFVGGKTDLPDVFNAVFGILATTIVIASAAIPEGLRLAFTITVAYSISQMAGNQTLVRDLAAFETFGSTTVICTNKSGTLNHMKVTRFWLGQEYVEEVASSPIAPHVLELLHQGVGLNRNEITSESSDAHSENHAEKAIYNWGLQEMNMDIKGLKNSCTILYCDAFNSEKKQGGILIRKKADNTIHEHQKGSPEVILDKCSHFIGDAENIKALDIGARVKLEEIIEGLAADGLQCIVFAHKNRSEQNDDGNFHRKLEEQGLTLLGLVGLKNACGPEVKKAVTDCKHAGVNIKMITGDDVPTATASAIECGILEQDHTIGEVVEGLEFRNCTHEERMEKVDKIRVITRATPDDKLLMVRCLKQRGHVVAVTGDPIEDLPALIEADVGLAMGIQATEAAKENSNIVILDDNFVSVVKALMWGRGTYDNIQRFTQFQLTVAIVSLVCDFVMAISAGEPPNINIVATVSAGEVPFAALQLLWVKLMVGALAALALTREKPTQELMKQPPIGRTKPFITNIIWMNVVVQALYLIAMLLTIHFKGKSIFNVNSRVNDTLIFNTLVLWQIFIIVNTRKFEDNVFKELQMKKLFWGTVGIIVLFQVAMVEWLKKYAKTERLNWGQWCICTGIAAVSWPLNQILKRIPVPDKPFYSFLKG